MDASEVRRFLTAHGLGCDALEERSEGIVNPCFLTAEHAVRFNVRDPGERKFANEAMALRLCADLPVPAVVLLDETRSVVDCDVLVTERLPGRSVDAQWHQLNADERAEVGEAAGRLLARLHGVRTPAFGTLTDQHPSWPDFVADRLDYTLEHLVAREELDEHEASALRGIVLGGLRVVAPRLVHLDFHFGNLLLHDGQLAVLDFEWCVGGDPLLDFRCLRDLQDEWPEAEAPFLAGYQAGRPLPPDWREHVDLLDLWMDLEYLELLHTHMLGTFDWADAELDRVRARLFSAT